MKARDYLADNGLAIRGARGRLSREAHAALEKAAAEGMTFSDYTPKHRPVSSPAPATRRAKAFVARQPRRTQTMIRIVGNDGISLRLDVCFACTESVRFCNCKLGPTATQFLTKDAQSVELV